MRKGRLLPPPKPEGIFVCSNSVFDISTSLS
jgi:hypothetical protein